MALEKYKHMGKLHFDFSAILRSNHCSTMSAFTSSMCYELHYSSLVGQGTGDWNTHTHTQSFLKQECQECQLESWMPTFLCSSVAYIVPSMTNGHAQALGIFSCKPPETTTLPSGSCAQNRFMHWKTSCLLWQAKGHRKFRVWGSTVPNNPHVLIFFDLLKYSF